MFFGSHAFRGWVGATALAAAWLFAGTVQATTLKEISGDEQIQQAETIFRGRADRIDAARDWTQPQGPVISTVRFTPLAVYKGTVDAPITLRFLGGTTADISMKVEGMPQFEVGQEYILFVSGAKNRVCPVVGWTEGTLRVDRLARTDGAVPVTHVASDWLRRTSIARTRSVMPVALGLPEFESLLRQRITEVGSK